MDNLGDNVHKGQGQKGQPPVGRPEIGQIGEDLACLFLKKHGYTIISRNYWKKWGEIDIVARKGPDWRFVEVKTVSRENFRPGDYEPEDNMHPWKLQRLRRVIETYLMEMEAKGQITDDDDRQVDLLSVYLDKEGRELKIDWLEDIVL